MMSLKCIECPVEIDEHRPPLGVRAIELEQPADELGVRAQADRGASERTILGKIDPEQRAAERQPRAKAGGRSGALDGCSVDRD